MLSRIRLFRASHPLFRTMATSAYIVPFDPKSSSSPSQVLPVDAAGLWVTAAVGEKVPKVGTNRIFYNIPAGKITALSSLGDGFAKKTGDARRELVRKSVGSAVKELKALDGLKNVEIDASADPHAAGKSSVCVAWK